jgi:hypothetical protein
LAAARVGSLLELVSNPPRAMPAKNAISIVTMIAPARGGVPLIARSCFSNGRAGPLVESPATEKCLKATRENVWWLFFLARKCRRVSHRSSPCALGGDGGEGAGRRSTPHSNGFLQGPCLSRSQISRGLTKTKSPRFQFHRLRSCPRRRATIRGRGSTPATLRHRIVPRG